MNNSKISDICEKLQKKTLIKALQLTVGLLLLGLLLYSVPLSKLGLIVHNLNWFYLGTVFFLSFVTILVSAGKLYILLHGAGYTPDYSAVLKAYYFGIFFNNYIPTSIGGDAVKVIFLSRDKKVSGYSATSAVTLERFSGLLVLVFFGLFASLYSPTLYPRMGVGFLRSGRFWSLLALTGGGLSLLVTLLIRWSEQSTAKSSFLKKIKESFHYPEFNTTSLFKIGLLGFSFQFIRGLNFVLLARAAGSRLPLLQALALLPIIALVSFLPISLGGLGLREGVITFCLQGVGITSQVGIFIALIFRGITIFHSLIGGGGYLLSRTFNLKGNDQEN